MPPGVCSQLAYFRINRCGIFFGWNMSVVWTFWPNGIILHLDFDAVGETYLPERTSLALMPAGDRSICFMYFSLMFTWLLLPKKVSVRTSRGRSTPWTVHDQGRVAYGVKRKSKSGRDNVCRPGSYVIGRMDGRHRWVKLDGVSVHWSTDGGGMAEVWSYLFGSLFESQTLKLEKLNFQ